MAKKLELGEEEARRDSLLLWCVSVPSPFCLVFLGSGDNFSTPDVHNSASLAASRPPLRLRFQFVRPRKNRSVYYFPLRGTTRAFGHKIFLTHNTWESVKSSSVFFSLEKCQGIPRSRNIPLASKLNTFAGEYLLVSAGCRLRLASLKWLLTRNGL